METFIIKKWESNVDLTVKFISKVENKVYVSKSSILREGSSPVFHLNGICMHSRKVVFKGVMYIDVHNHYCRLCPYCRTNLNLVHKSLLPEMGRVIKYLTLLFPDARLFDAHPSVTYFKYLLRLNPRDMKLAMAYITGIKYDQMIGLVGDESIPCWSLDVYQTEDLKDRFISALTRFYPFLDIMVEYINMKPNITVLAKTKQIAKCCESTIQYIKRLMKSVKSSVNMDISVMIMPSMEYTVLVGDPANTPEKFMFRHTKLDPYPTVTSMMNYVNPDGSIICIRHVANDMPPFADTISSALSGYIRANPGGELFAFSTGHLLQDVQSAGLLLGDSETVVELPVRFIGSVDPMMGDDLFILVNHGNRKMCLVHEDPYEEFRFDDIEHAVVDVSVCQILPTLPELNITVLPHIRHPENDTDMPSLPPWSLFQCTVYCRTSTEPFSINITGYLNKVHTFGWRTWIEVLYLGRVVHLPGNVPVFIVPGFRGLPAFVDEQQTEVHSFITSAFMKDGSQLVCLSPAPFVLAQVYRILRNKKLSLRSVEFVRVAVPPNVV